MTQDTEPAIDVAALTQFMKSIGDDPRIMRRLIDVYLADAPRQLELINTGISEQNLERVNRGAHTLKSTSATMGATRLSQMSRELEAQTAPGGDGAAIAASGDISARASALADELERVRLELDAFVPPADQL